jgi:hypothetical protein
MHRRLSSGSSEVVLRLQICKLACVKQGRTASGAGWKVAVGDARPRRRPTAAH